MRCRLGVAVGGLAAALIGLGPPAPAVGACPAPAEATYESGAPPRTGAFPNDPLLERQWGLDLVKAPAAWARGARGAGAVIAIVDSGVDLRHPDLRDRLVGGVDIAQGGEGEAADCPEGPQDAFYHGTFAAGIAAASADNGIGIAGVAPLAQIMPVQFDDLSVPTVIGDERYRDHAVEAFRYAADHGADVISFSAPLGHRSLDPAYIEPFEAAVEYAWSKGAVVVVAAGNYSAPACQTPASARRAICVASIDRHGRPPIYSSQPWHLGGGVALRAPGGGDETPDACAADALIWSTTLPSQGRGCPGAAGYDQRSGTSWAAPHVAGVVALLAGMGLTNDEIVECLKRTSSGRGTSTPTMGYGIVDADAATAECGRPSVGPQPRSLQLTVRPRTVAAGRQVRLRIRVRSAAGPAAGALVRVAGRRIRTDAGGRARVAVRWARPGRRLVVARLEGHAVARRWVTVRGAGR